MKVIRHITDSPKQELSVLLDDGTFFTMEVYYIPLQQGWFINKLTYEDFTVYGIRICNSPNLLHQFRNLIPFGLACFSEDKREPLLQIDFVEQNCELFVLTADEVDAYQEIVVSG